MHTKLSLQQAAGRRTICMKEFYAKKHYLYECRCASSCHFFDGIVCHSIDMEMGECLCG